MSQYAVIFKEEAPAAMFVYNLLLYIKTPCNASVVARSFIF